MAEINKVSVEKAIEKIRSGDELKSKDASRSEKMDALDEEISRMRAQRMRLERHKRQRD